MTNQSAGTGGGSQSAGTGPDLYYGPPDKNRCCAYQYEKRFRVRVIRKAS